DYDRAVADYSEAIRLKSDPDTFYNRAIAYQKKGDLDRAIADYDEAIRLDPKNPAYYRDRGIAWCALGNNERGVADETEAKRLTQCPAAASVIARKHSRRAHARCETRCWPMSESGHERTSAFASAMSV